MIKTIEKRNKSLYLITNAIAILISYLTFMRIYNNTDASEEIVKKGHGYVKLIRYDYGPALYTSIVTLIILIILIAVIYKKTNFFTFISEKVDFKKIASKRHEFSFLDILTIEKLSPTLAVKYLYHITLILIIGKFIFTLFTLLSISTFAFRYNMLPVLSGLGASLFSIVVSLIFAKLVFVLIHNHFLLVEKNLKLKE